MSSTVAPSSNSLLPRLYRGLVAPCMLEWTVTAATEYGRMIDMLTIAHRGASGYAPENTRAAFDRAIAMDAAMIETDVQMTADGQLVLWHDAFVDRNSN